MQIFAGCVEIQLSYKNVHNKKETLKNVIEIRVIEKILVNSCKASLSEQVCFDKMVVKMPQESWIAKQVAFATAQK
ncbi:MAG: hypothetical protein IT258_12340 [Saprospiraceae bacterium]|nr:hypothetical protein [Saprospiraceae bacterium]